MIRAAFVGVAVGTTLALAGFAPMVRTLAPEQRAWLATAPRTRR